MIQARFYINRMETVHYCLAKHLKIYTELDAYKHLSVFSAIMNKSPFVNARMQVEKI